jgi:hypothetical protein
MTDAAAGLAATGASDSRAAGTTSHRSRRRQAPPSRRFASRLERGGLAANQIAQVVNECIDTVLDVVFGVVHKTSSLMDGESLSTPVFNKSVLSDAVAAVVGGDEETTRVWASGSPRRTISISPTPEQAFAPNHYGGRVTYSVN